MAQPIQTNKSTVAQTRAGKRSPSALQNQSTSTDFLKNLQAENLSNSLKKSNSAKKIANSLSSSATQLYSSVVNKADQRNKNITQIMCESRKVCDDELELKAESVRMNVLRDKLASKTCRTQAETIATTINRFDRYGDALPYARAANEMNKLGDNADTSSAQYKRAQQCIRLLPLDAKKLSAELGLPQDTLTSAMLRDDDTGFRAALFKDEATGKTILVARDTQPNSLVDWMTNIDNGKGEDTPQYEAMRILTRTLDEKVPFDLAGYSKGSTLAQEAGLIAKSVQVRIFNAAGLHENSLLRTNTDSFNSLIARTKSFSSQGEFLTFMNETSDPKQQIANAIFLRKELAGEGRGLNPIEIKYRNPKMRAAYDKKGWFDKNPDPDFVNDKTALLSDMTRMISGYQKTLTTGTPFKIFPSVRSATHEVVINSESTLAKYMPFAGDINANKLNLAKLIQHQMTAVLEPMKASVKDDRLTLYKFVDYCK